MKKATRKLMVICIILSSTQVINLPFGGLTLFQIFLILTGVAGIASLIEQRYIKKGSYLLFGIVYILSSCLAYFVSTYPEWARSYLLLGFMGAMFFLIMPNIFTVDDIPMLEKTLIRSQYITILFSIYSFYMFYFKGGIPEYISLFGGMYIELDPGTLQRAQAASQVRLTLPYATPPVLSIVMAMCIALLLFNPKLYKSGSRWLLTISFTIILILTGSRTGMVGLLTVILIWGIDLLIKKKLISKNLFMAICFGILMLLIILWKSNNIEYIQKLIYRFTSVDLKDIMSDRHFTVPLDGIIIYVSSVKNFIVGIGFGSSYYIEGAHTYLPPYFLNSFVTLLAERGIMGAFLVYEMLRLGKCMFKCKNVMNKNYVSLGYMILAALISSLFYEALNCYFILIALAMGFMLQSHLNCVPKVGLQADMESVNS